MDEKQKHKMTREEYEEYIARRIANEVKYLDQAEDKSSRYLDEEEIEEEEAEYFNEEQSENLTSGFDDNNSDDPSRKAAKVKESKTRQASEAAAASEWDVREETRSEEQLRREGFYSKKKKRSRNILLHKMSRGLRFAVSGNILTSNLVRKYYKHLFVIALMFFFNIATLFWALHLDTNYYKLSREVQLLRERSIRLREQSADLCSHSAILKELQKRGIKLVDTTSPAIIIND